MKRSIALCGAMMLVALASCSTDRPAPRPRVAEPTPVPPAVPRAVAPGEYVAAAGSIDLFVVRASELALARSTDLRVRHIAERLADEHRGLGAQLSLGGRWLDVLPAARLAPREERRLARLDARPTDTTYLVEMHAAHDQSLALHSVFAARGTSPTLRPVAANGARVEQAHRVLLGRGA